MGNMGHRWDQLIDDEPLPWWVHLVVGMVVGFCVAYLIWA